MKSEGYYLSYRLGTRRGAEWKTATNNRKEFFVFQLIKRDCKPCHGGWPTLIHKEWKTEKGKLCCSYYYGNDVEARTLLWIEINGKKQKVGLPDYFSLIPPEDYEVEEIFREWALEN